jgi:outer membrane protein with beta-barrel domain
MQRIRIGQGGAVLVAALASALAFTAGIAPRAEAVGGNVGGHVGYSKMKDAEGGAVLVGGHGELRLIRWLGVQGAVDYRHVSSFDIATPNGQGELSVREIPITVTGRVYMPISKVSPFAAAGPVGTT